MNGKPWNKGTLRKKDIITQVRIQYRLSCQYYGHFIEEYYKVMPQRNILCNLRNQQEASPNINEKRNNQLSNTNS